MSTNQNDADADNPQPEAELSVSGRIINATIDELRKVRDNDSFAKSVATSLKELESLTEQQIKDLVMSENGEA